MLSELFNGGEGGGRRGEASPGLCCVNHRQMNDQHQALKFLDRPKYLANCRKTIKAAAQQAAWEGAGEAWKVCGGCGRIWNGTDFQILNTTLANSWTMTRTSRTTVEGDEGMLRGRGSARECEGEECCEQEEGESVARTQRKNFY